MKKLVVFLVSVGFLFSVSAKAVDAQTEPYFISKFDSNIVINQDSSITVTEEIQVLFNESRHGIYRTIPVIYRTKDKTINSRLKVLSVKDEKGDSYTYEMDRFGDGVRIKIGDADKFVSGKKVYKIVYWARSILQRYEDHEELYWNIVGSGWDTSIRQTHARVTSEFAPINSIQCFEGLAGSSETKCNFFPNIATSAEFSSNSILGNGKDMTIVVALNKNNQIAFGPTLSSFISDHWAYPVSLLPFLIIFLAWYKKGRDQRFIGDNVYYTPQNAKIENLPLINKREFLPLVYSPINGLTPAQVGTILDERVDIADVVAEIMELGRLGYLKIKKIVKKLAKDDYLITKTDKKVKNLKEYQEYLLDSLFEFGDTKNEVKLSELKAKFYTKLHSFREKLYKDMKESEFFVGRPDWSRVFWMLAGVGLCSIPFFASILFIEELGDFVPMIVLVVTFLPMLFLAYNMPRRTPKGYAYFQRAVFLLIKRQMERGSK